MTQLKSMHITILDAFNLSLLERPKVYLADLAGSLPALEEFSFQFGHSFCLKVYNASYKIFVEQYGQKYPEKKLTLKCIRLKADLESSWPPCLSVEELRVHGLHSSNFARLTSSITCPVKKVKFNKMPVTPLYQLAEKIGPDIIHLTIDERVDGFYDRDYCTREEPLDLSKVLAACPKVEIVQIFTDGPFSRSTFHLQPEHFSCYKDFKVRCGKLDGSQDEIWKIYRQFLIGCRNSLSSLECHSVNQLRAISWALQQESCTCLDELQVVDFKVEGGVETKEEIVMCIGLLAQRCPFLRKINVVGVDDWVQPFYKSVGITVSKSDFAEEDELSVSGSDAGGRRPEKMARKVEISYPDDDTDEEERQREKEKAEFVAGVKRMRNEATVPDTLMVLTMKHIMNKCSYFSSKPQYHFLALPSPFKNLPNSVVQMFLSMIFKNRKQLNYYDDSDLDDFVHCKFFDGHEEENYFTLQLLNSSVTEFDPQYLSVLHPSIRAMIVRHLLENCPNVKNISVDSSILDNFAVLPLLSEADFFFMMASRWKNLSFISATGIISIRIILDFVEKFPNLRGLEINLRYFTLGMLKDKLLKMEQLKYFHLAFTKRRDFTWTWSEFVDEIGRLPFLEQISLKCVKRYSDDCKKFVECYGQMFPGKKLNLKGLWLKSDLEKPWPSCLSIDRLHLSGRQRSSFARLSSTITCPVKKVKFNNIPATLLYQLAEKFGPEITELTIEDGKYNAREEPLDLSRVLAACPRTEFVGIFTKGPFSKSTIPLKPEHFTRYKDFKVCCDGSQEEEIWKIYKQFLLGCKNFLESLECTSINHLRAVAWALEEETCVCLHKLKRVKIKVEEDEETKDEISRIVELLVENCPLLQSMNVNCFKGNDNSNKQFVKLFGITAETDSSDDEDQLSDEGNIDSDE